MHDAVGMDVFERFKHADGDAEAALLGDAAFGENLAQQASVAPLHDHVHAGAFLTAEDAHDLGVVKLFANLRFALEAIEEEGIGFKVGVGDFERDDAVISQVGGAVDGGHAAAGNGRVDAVGIDLGAGLQAVEETHGAARSSGGFLSMYRLWAREQ